MVHQLSIQREVNPGRIPFHDPGMELGSPRRSTQSFGRNGWIGPPPFSVHDVEQNLVRVVFHHVNFSAGGPASRYPRGPPGRPASRSNINAPSHLEPAV